jgi:putative heme iron utilization protein
MPDRNPINPTTDDARALAQSLLRAARFGALAVIDPKTGAPSVTRIGLGSAPDGQPVTLISSLSSHTSALRRNPACSLLVGEPGPRGDPLTHPRMTLACRASFVAHGGPGWTELRARYLTQVPKAQLYIDFADFSFARLTVQSAALNGGVGKAFALGAEDLGLPAPD